MKHTRRTSGQILVKELSSIKEIAEEDDVRKPPHCLVVSITTLSHMPTK